MTVISLNGGSMDEWPDSAVNGLLGSRPSLIGAAKAALDTPGVDPVIGLLKIGYQAKEQVEFIGDSLELARSVTHLDITKSLGNALKVFMEPLLEQQQAAEESQEQELEDSFSPTM